MGLKPLCRFFKTALIIDREGRFAAMRVLR